MPVQHSADWWVGSLAMTITVASVDPDPQPILKHALREFLAENRGPLADLLRTTPQGKEAMTEQWRNHYDRWKLAPGNTRYATEVLDDDGEPVDQDVLDAQAEAAAEERAERRREDMMFDRESWDE